MWAEDAKRSISVITPGRLYFRFLQETENFTAIAFSPC